MAQTLPGSAGGQPKAALPSGTARAGRLREACCVAVPSATFPVIGPVVADAADC